MKPSFRLTLLLTSLAGLLLPVPTSLAQENRAGEPPPPPPAVAPAPPPAPVAAPAAPAAPAAVASEAASDSERPLRRLDAPAEAGETKPNPAPTEKKRREPRTRTSGGGSGDAPFGDHVVGKDRRVREVVSVFGSTTVEGAVDGDAVSVMGRTRIGPEGRVGGAAVAVLGPLESRGAIGGDAVSVLGGADIDGPVKGEVVSVMGDLRLGPNAVVERDIVLVGGKLVKDPGAIVRGNQINVPLLGGLGDVTWLTTWLKRCVFLGRPLAFGEHLGWAWLVALSFLALYVLLALLFRGGIDKCVTTLETRPGMSFVSALLSVLLSPVVLVLLVATVVGLIVVPFLGLGLMVAKLFGKAVMLAWLGRRITRLAGPGPLEHPAFAVLIGGGIVLLLYTVPLFGFLLYKVLSWIGLGVVVFTLALAMKRDTPAPAAVAGAGGSGGEPPAAGGGSPFTVPVPPVPATPAPLTSAGFSEAPAAAAGTPLRSGGWSPSLGFSAPPGEFTSAGGAAVPPPAVAAAAVPAGMPGATGPRPMPVISTATCPRAGLMIRLAALALDGILIGMVLGFVSGLLPRFLQFNSGPGGLLILLAVYGAVLWKHKGTTIGGIVCGLKVVRIDHRELDWATACVRALGCFLSLIVAGLGFFWVAFDDEKQSWHDKIAGTTVVRVPKGVSLL